ncbi:MAG: argininosuccinate lyase [Candidatus Hydrogenedentes bacterium CG07_land_8_20_14_0_80_42_17]|nr:MAG: argininosuccinate lyase [Candidatus Hydrogenedentes bacterium CG07_land_8_20_14_0_80_42_17]
MKTRKKLWGGGYGKATAGIVEQFTQSVSFDKRLAPFDIRGSIAHAEMLGRTGIISRKDSDKIVRGLKTILSDIEKGKFTWDESLEDLHMNIESELTRRIGEAGKRLHTGRSRNDQVATAFRLYCADASRRIIYAIRDLISAIDKVSKQYKGKLMPAYTHLQQAQPTTFDLWLSAYREMLLRDIARFEDAASLAMASSPLGSGALMGSSLPLDRKYTAEKLGFEKVSVSTLDSVSDRDFALELLFASALFQIHLSRLAEDLIVYSTKEFGFVKLDDSVTTGSSLMPQKKNPDVCELTRGKSGRVIGNLVSLLTTIKGLPMTYNRDLQEDKEPVFDSVDTVILSASAMSLAVNTMKFNSERAESAIDPSMMATDLAEHLVEHGMPFREAHETVARLIHSGVNLSKCVAADLEELHPLLKGAFNRLSPHESVRRRSKR